MTPLEFKLTQELAQATKSLESALERCRHSEELCTGLMVNAPIMIEFKAWLDEHYPKVPPNSEIAKATRYMLKFWNGLTVFLEDGRLKPDSNLTEQAIKPL